MKTPHAESPASAHCQLLYFTSGSLTADGAFLTGITDAYGRAGGASLARIERATGIMEPLAIFPGFAMQAYPYFQRSDQADPFSNGPVATHGLNKSSPCLHEASGNLFFVWGREDGTGQLDCVNVRSGHRRMLTEISRERSVGYCHVDASGEFVLLSLADSRVLELGKKRKANSEIAEAFAREHLTTQLMEVSVATGEHRVLWEEPGWVTHIQYHPTRRDVILFNHEWTWPLGTQRMWLKTGRVSDSLSNIGHTDFSAPSLCLRHPSRAIRFRDSPDVSLDNVAHEVWQDDGAAVIYHGAFWDEREKRLEQFVGRAPLASPQESLAEISIPAAWPSHYGHFYPSRTGKFVITDAIADQRGDRLRRGNLITRLEMDWERGIMGVTPLCESGSSWRSQDEHPHPVLSPDEREVLFNSDVSGVRRIYSVRAGGDRQPEIEDRS